MIPTFLGHHSQLWKNSFKGTQPVQFHLLYGSYARDEAKDDSDIDVAVVVRHFHEDWLLSRAKLFRLRRDS